MSYMYIYKGSYGGYVASIGKTNWKYTNGKYAIQATIEARVARM